MNYINVLKQNENFECWLGANEKQIDYIEKELHVKLPEQYKRFLSQCGMCNFGDVNILGIAKEENRISYPVVDLTKQMREEVSIPNDLIILSYEVGEYLTLYKVSENKVLDDASIYGAVVKYDNNEKISLGKFEKLFNSFEEYFEDFVELGS